MTTPIYKHNSTLAHIAASVVYFTLTAACVSNAPGDGDGDSGTSETDTLEPGAEVRCVELTPGQVSCWVDWDLAWARVMLPCQVDAGVEGLFWTEGYDDVIEPWGPVVCHDTLPDGRFCLYGESNVLLVETTSGWLPQEVSALAGTLPVVEPPCGLCGEPGQPLCEVSDCPLASLGCGCIDGGCEVGFGCTVANTCVDCQFNTGVQGCACSLSGECENGSCVADMCT